MEVEKSSPHTFTPDFGIYSRKLGTAEETVITTQVDRIHESAKPMIGLSAFQMENVRHPYGPFYLKNLTSNKEMEMEVEVYNAFGPMCSKTSEQTIAITDIVATTLGLKENDWVEIHRKMDDRGALLHRLAHEKTNPFGRTWDEHGYVGDGIMMGTFEDRVPGRFEVTLTDMQRSYLRIEKHLAPLCGEKKYLTIKVASPEAIGAVKLFVGNQEIEADVHWGYPAQQQGCSLWLSKSLCEHLQSVEVGTPIAVCSRFDCSNLEEARTSTTRPAIPDFTVTETPYLELIKTTRLEELQTRFSHEEDPHQFEAANALKHLAGQAEQVAQDPKLMAKITHLWGFRCTSTMEYKDFRKAIGNHINVMKERWDEYLEVADEELKKKDPHYFNPTFVADLVKLGLLDHPSSRGETLLHRACKLGRGCLETLFKKSQNPYAQDDQGRIPFHYACREGLFVVPITWRHKNPLMGDAAIAKDGSTPLHDACRHSRSTMVTSVLEFIPESHKWLSIADNEGKKPLDLLEKGHLSHLLLQIPSKETKKKDSIKQVDPKEVRHSLMAALKEIDSEALMVGIGCAMTAFPDKIEWLNLKDEEGATLLDYLPEKELLRLCVLLIKFQEEEGKPCDPNHPIFQKISTSICASEEKMQEAIEFLRRIY